MLSTRFDIVFESDKHLQMPAIRYYANLFLESYSYTCICSWPKLTLYLTTKNLDESVKKRNLSVKDKLDLDKKDNAELGKTENFSIDYIFVCLFSCTLIIKAIAQDLALVVGKYRIHI